MVEYAFTPTSSTQVLLGLSWRIRSCCPDLLEPFLPVIRFWFVLTIAPSITWLGVDSVYLFAPLIMRRELAVLLTDHYAI